MNEQLSSAAIELTDKIEKRSAMVGIVGLGYVGLPMAVETAQSGFSVLGFDIDPRVVSGVNSGRSHIKDVADERLVEMTRQGRLTATSEMGRLAECDAIAICVPTPLNKIKDPDLSYVVKSVSEVGKRLRAGQLVVLESTTYPGTTREVVLEELLKAGQAEGGGPLQVGSDFFLCYSPERVDPGNVRYHIRNTPKVIGGLTPTCLGIGTALYNHIFDTLVPVSSPEAAELTKVYENTFRMINIALANELAQACDKLGVDVWEVIEAADSKPFGFLKFTPGPGLGGHCIPLDPHYLSWKMRELAFKTRLIELASEINSGMPGFVVSKVSEALNAEGKAIRGSRILISGVSYKKDIGDLRESPAIEIIRRLLELGGQVDYHDPYNPEFDLEMSDGRLERLTGVALEAGLLRNVDAVVIVTDHGDIHYDRILDEANLIIDTRGALRGRSGRARIIPLAGPVREGRQETAAIGEG